MGELAALGTAVCWTFTSIFFSVAGREVGSATVNRVRLLMAVLFLMITHQILLGTPFPVSASPERWLWLGISGIVGLAIGDAMLFQALVLIGPRLSMLLMAIVPVLSTFIAWLTLGEVLSWVEISAVILTISGIGWVILERSNGTVAGQNRQYTTGILFGLGGAVGQALGLVSAKQGLIGDFPVLSGVLMRMAVAMVAIWLVTILRGKVKSSFLAMRNRRALLATTGGSFFGPFIGVWLSLVAVDLARVGIASTLMALSPILILPVSKWILKERISIRAVLGTMLALVGVATIFLLGQ